MYSLISQRHCCHAQALIIFYLIFCGSRALLSSQAVHVHYYFSLKLNLYSVILHASLTFYLPHVSNTALLSILNGSKSKCFTTSVCIEEKRALCYH